MTLLLECIFVFFVVAVVTIIIYLKWLFSYWKRKNVGQIDPRIPLGNLENPLFVKKGLNGIFSDAYKEFKLRRLKYGGLYLLHLPIFVPIDPELIKNILTVDFTHFPNRGNLVDEKNDPLSANLANLEDERWKNLRAKLSPTFTPGKTKLMFDAMIRCSTEMRNYIRKLSLEEKPLDIRDIFNCYSTDIIGSCAFGIDCNSFKNPNTEFRKYGRQVLATDLISSIRLFMMFITPELSKMFKIKPVRQDVEDFFITAVKNIVNHRVSTNTKRYDFIQMLLDIGKDTDKDSETSLTTLEMAAQVFIFLLAGFETSAATITFCFYELALNEDIQKKIRNEICRVRKRFGGGLTYESLAEMTYMDQVIEESLRKYPSIPFLNRKCSKAYKIPNSDVIIEEGTKIFISVLEIQRDPDHFTDPEKFDPDRFSKENRAKIRPFTYIPFGDGPRICIGMRFATMQIKIGLASILSEFKILPHESTPAFVEFNPRSLVIMPKETLLVKAQPL